MKSLDVAKETREVFISKISTIENLSHGMFELHSIFLYVCFCVLFYCSSICMYAFVCFVYALCMLFIGLFVLIFIPVCANFICSFSLIKRNLMLVTTQSVQLMHLAAFRRYSCTHLYESVGVLRLII